MKVREALAAHRNPPAFVFKKPGLAAILSNTIGGSEIRPSEAMVYRYVFGEKDVVITFTHNFETYKAYKKYGVPIVPLEYPHEIVTEWSPSGWSRSQVLEFGLNRCVIVKYLGKTIDNKIVEAVEETCKNGFVLPDISGLAHDYYKAGRFYGRLHTKGISPADQGMHNLCIHNHRIVSIDWDGEVFQLDRMGFREDLEEGDLYKSRLSPILEGLGQPEEYRKNPAFREMRDRLKYYFDKGYKETAVDVKLVGKAHILD
jgi:hypothetical protein